MSIFTERPRVLIGALAALAPALLASICNPFSTGPNPGAARIELTVFTASAYSGDLVISWRGEGPEERSFDWMENQFEDLDAARRFQLDPESPLLLIGGWTFTVKPGDDPEFSCFFQIPTRSESRTIAISIDETSGGGCSLDLGEFSGHRDVTIEAIEATSGEEEGALVIGDDSIRVSVTATNLGAEATALFDVEAVSLVALPTEEGEAEEEVVPPPFVPQSQSLALVENESETLEFAWETGDLAEGGYRVTFEAGPLDGELATDAETGDVLYDNTLDNTLDVEFTLVALRDLEITGITVDPAEPLRFDPGPAGLPAGEATITVRVRNNGVAELAGIEVFAVEDPGGIGPPPPPFTVAPGEERTETFAWDLSQLPVRDFDEDGDRSKRYEIAFAVSEPEGDVDPMDNRRSLEVLVKRDRDRDLIADEEDMCLEISIAQPADGQVDADGDGIGNRCDADFNQDGLVGAEDVNYYASVRTALDQGLDHFYSRVMDVDWDGVESDDDAIGPVDDAIFIELFGDLGPAARSGLRCACATKNTPTAYFHPKADPSEPPDAPNDFRGDDPPCLTGEEPKFPCLEPHLPLLPPP